MRLRHTQLVRGIPLWGDENTIVLDGVSGEVSRIHGEGSGSDLIADDLSTFFRHFVAAGCFFYGGAGSEHFHAYWDRIRPVVPFGIAPADNLWLRHLVRWYDGDLLGG
jgi:hypothetical protein